MNDFESRLKTLLNERVDAKIGTREAPRFVPTGKARRIDSVRRRAPWVVPLLAAACVAAIVGGSVGAAHLLADKHHSPAPATQVPGPKDTPTPSPSPSPSYKTDESGLVTLAGATLPLPSGWVARDYLRYEPPLGEGQTITADLGWCLTPASTPVRVGACPIWFRPFQPTARNALAMDVDNRGGSYGNPHQVCYPNGSTHSDLEAGEFTFGGRMADWRHWRYDCASGPAFVAEQYVVATRPAYIIFSEQVTDSVHQVMSDLAAHSSLPPSATSMRYEDFGYVRHIKIVANGIQVSIDHTVRDLTADSDHTTVDYVVPNKVYAAGASSLKVGKLAQVITNGTRVTMIYGYGT